jgi:hypothetical protein
MSDDVPWLERAYSRVITNTITKLRIMRKQQGEDCLVEAYRRIESEYTPEEVDAVANPFDLLTDEDRDDLRSRFPLSSLSEGAETFEADLEVKWRSTLRLMVAEKSSMTVSRSSTGPAYYRPQWAFQHAPSATRNIGPKKRMRGSDRDMDMAEETYGTSQWLRDLPSIGAVHFAKSCVLQSDEIERSRRALPAGCSETGISDSAKKQLGHLLYAEQQCRIKQQQEVSQDSNRSEITYRSGEQLRSEDQLAVVEVPGTSDFNWTVVPLRAPSDADDGDLLPFLWPSDDIISSISCGAVVYASFNVAAQPRKHHWQSISTSYGSIRVPCDLVAGTLIIPGRGEVAVSKVRWS